MIKFTVEYDGVYVRDYEKEVNTYFLDEDRVVSFLINKRKSSTNYYVRILAEEDASWEIASFDTYAKAQELVMSISNKMYLNKLVDVDNMKEEIANGSKV